MLPDQKFVMSVLMNVMIAVMAVPASGQMCTPAHECGDVNESDDVTAGDALAVLKRAVGLSIALTCSCNGGEECQLGGDLKTGQTMCWDVLDTIIPVDPIDCPGTGQDGEYQKGLAVSFQDNGDGTITDQRTTLMWEKLSNDGSIHDVDDVAFWWAGAFKKVSDLNSQAFAGYSDWRLPNARELNTLTNFAAYNPAVDPAFNNNCLPGCTQTECSCTNEAPYWSSTTIQFTPQNAWALDFKTASMVSNKQKWPPSSSSTPSVYVRAVRGGY